MLRSINWVFILFWFLRGMSILSWLLAVAWLIFDPGFEPMIAILIGMGAFGGSLWANARQQQTQIAQIEIFPQHCGEEALDLAEQRLLISTAFGSYFVSLLERDHSYVHLADQINAPALKGLEALSSIQRIYGALQYPKGPRLFIIAGEGGMGKTTLATKIIRCLLQEEAVDLILGDSAKTQHIDPATNTPIAFEAGYDTVSSFYQRLCSQLAIPFTDERQVLTVVKDRLEGRKAIIIVDNLETIKQGDKLLRSLLTITSRDIRAIVTTRQIDGLQNLTRNSMLIHLNPLSETAVIKEFLQWHIQQYQQLHPALATLQTNLERKQLQWLLQHTGGIPLLIQILASDVARFSWAYLNNLPNLFGKELLDFLYKARWKDLQNLGRTGLIAREILRWVNHEQYRGNKVTFKQLTAWAETKEYTDDLSDALTLLFERFLLINHDHKDGNFAIFPSLAEFLQQN